MCIAVDSVLLRVDVRNAGGIAVNTDSVQRGWRIIETTSVRVVGGDFSVKRAWGIRVPKEGYFLRGFLRRCAWLLR